MDERLSEQRRAWDKKPSLRAVYGDMHRRILASCVPGNVLEVGAGSGHLCEIYPEIIGLDVLPAPWLDVVGDGEQLPFADRSFDNLVMLDVLHHLPRPRAFFTEAQRVLRRGGRIVMIEPGITPLSWPFLNFFHHEDVWMSVDPLGDVATKRSAHPFDSNQAVPTLLFKRRRNRRRFTDMFPQLRIRKARWLSLWAYPLTGGFQAWSLMPPSLVPGLLRLEEIVLPVLGPLAAFRLQVVVEKTS